MPNLTQKERQNERLLAKSGSIVPYGSVFPRRSGVWNATSLGIGMTNPSTEEPEWVSREDYGKQLLEYKAKEKAQEPSWLCVKCGQTNSGWATECGRCETPREDTISNPRVEPGPYKGYLHNHFPSEQECPACEAYATDKANGTVLNAKELRRCVCGHTKNFHFSPLCDFHGCGCILYLEAPSGTTSELAIPPDAKLPIKCPNPECRKGTVTTSMGEMSCSVCGGTGIWPHKEAPRGITESKEVRSAGGTDAILEHPDGLLREEIRSKIYPTLGGQYTQELEDKAVKDILTLIRRSQSEYAIKVLEGIKATVEQIETFTIPEDIFDQAISDERGKLG